MDVAHEITDIIIKEIETTVAREYKKAKREIGHKADEYFKSFEKKEKRKRDQLRRGVITMEEYIEWRKGQLLINSRWEELRNTLAEDNHHANKIATQVIMGYMPDIYALNHAYGTYLVENGSRLDTSYTLYSREAAEYVLKGQPLLPSTRQHGKNYDYRTSAEYQMPRLGKKSAQRIKDNQDVLWNVQQIQSVALQGILQGLSITHLAEKLQEVTDNNHKAAIRNARTMATNVQNAGRQDAFERAQSMGIEMQKTWVSTLDNRTRHEHRLLNGQTVDVDKMFTVEGMEIEYPGDPYADASMVYNCRCTMITQLKGFERDVNALRNDPALGDMTYEEWLNAKAESHPIDKQERIAKIMKGKYSAEYRK